MSMLKTGTVKHWNERGFAFIKPDDQPSPDVFCHKSNCAEELDELREGQRVQYVERISPRNGKPEAIAVEVM
jgi:cold shock CspA family protein